MAKRSLRKPPPRAARRLRRAEDRPEEEGTRSDEVEIESLLDADADAADGNKGAPVFDDVLPALSGDTAIVPAQPPGPLAPFDPLGAYLREIGRYPVLTVEEEHALAVRYYQDHDVDAAAQLVTANLRLVVKIAFEYRRAFRNVMDLIQEGNIGLMQAVKKFDPYRGVKLSTYSAWWIRAYILRYILNNWRLVKIGTTQAQRRLFFNLSKEKRRLEALGVDPTPARIAERLDVTREEVVEMERRLSAPEASLDAPVRPGESSDRRALARLDLVSDENVSVDEALALAEFNEVLHEKVAAYAETLSGREADVFRNRLWADEPETLQEIGDRYGMTREGVRQIEKKILRKLREYLEAEMGEHLEFR